MPGENLRKCCCDEGYSGGVGSDGACTVDGSAPTSWPFNPPPMPPTPCQGDIDAGWCTFEDVIGPAMIAIELPISTTALGIWPDASPHTYTLELQFDVERALDIPGVVVGNYVRIPGRCWGHPHRYYSLGGPRYLFCCSGGGGLYDWFGLLMTTRNVGNIATSHLRFQWVHGGTGTVNHIGDIIGGPHNGEAATFPVWHNEYMPLDDCTPSISYPGVTWDYYMNSYDPSSGTGFTNSLWDWSSPVRVCPINDVPRRQWGAEPNSYCFFCPYEIVSTLPYGTYGGPYYFVYY